ncbi:MAG: hypothetical protein WCO84_09650, partial [bacterium]
MFATNKTERMRLSATGGLSIGNSTYNGTDSGAGNVIIQGNVGIGSTSPQQKLDVNGIVNATDFYKNGSAFTGSQWTTSGSNIYYSTGNVGIGATAPTALFEVGNNTNSATGLIVTGGGGGSGTTIVDIKKYGGTSVFRIAGNGSINLGGAASISGLKALTISDTTPGGLLTLQNSTYGSLAVPEETILKFTGGGDYNRAAIVSLDKATNVGGGWLKLQTADSSGVLQDRMIIDAGGNVGIGTTAPGAALEVNQNGRAVDALRIVRTDLSQWALSFFNGTTQKAGFDSYGTSWNSSTNGDLTINPGTGKVTLLQNNVVPFTSDGAGAIANTLYLKQGNVGIGTTAPNYKLDLYSTANNFIRVQSAGVAGAFFQDPATYANVSTYGDGTLRLQADSGGFDAATSQLVLKSGGNVGIGTAAPAQKLEVLGTVKATAFIGDGAGITNLGAATGWTTAAGKVYATNLADNVGIGTTASTLKLDVNGDLRVNDSVYSRSALYLRPASGAVGLYDAVSNYSLSISAGSVIKVLFNSVGDS